MWGRGGGGRGEGEEGVDKGCVVILDGKKWVYREWRERRRM